MPGQQTPSPRCRVEPTVDRPWLRTHGISAARCQRGNAPGSECRRRAPTRLLRPVATTSSRIAGERPGQRRSRRPHCAATQARRPHRWRGFARAAPHDLRLTSARPPGTATLPVMDAPCGAAGAGGRVPRRRRGQVRRRSGGPLELRTQVQAQLIESAIDQISHFCLRPPGERGDLVAGISLEV